VTKEEIEDKLRSLAPFHHDVELPYGLRTYLPEHSRRELERTRLPNLVKHVWPSLLKACGGSLEGQRVLDVACNCGGFSIEAINSGAEYVLGIDIVDRYLEQANFIKRARNLEKIEFRKMAVEDLDEATIGKYDITFCFGILYHLENPVLVMRKLSSVTRRIIVVDTSVFRSSFLREPTWRMRFPPSCTTQSRSVSTSMWRTEGICELMPNAQAVIDLLKLVSFPNVKRIKPITKGLEKRYYAGRRLTFLAARE
jgi:SAM-dependent methyltransferase